MYYCRNGGCSFRTISRHGLQRHKCKYTRTNRVASAYAFFQASTDGSLNSNDKNNAVANDHAPDCSDSVFNGSSIPGKDQSGQDDIWQEGIEQFCSVLDLCSDKQGITIFKSILDVLLNKSFSLDAFRTKIKSFKCCLKMKEQMFARSAHENNFKREEVCFDDGREIHSSLLYRKNVIQVLQKQVEMANKEDFHFNCSEFRTDRENYDTPCFHPMETSEFQALETDIRRRVMGSTDANLVWHDNDKIKSFGGFVQIFTDKTVTTLKCNGMAAHAVHAVLLNTTKKYRRYLIQNGYSIIGFLPTCIHDVRESTGLSQNPNNFGGISFTECDEAELISADLTSVQDQLETDNRNGQTVLELMDKVTLTSTAKGRHVKMGLLHKSMKIILRDLANSSEYGFPITLNNGVKLTCFPQLISYCCDIPEGKDMTAVKHNLNTLFPCHNCLVLFEDIVNLQTKPRRTFEDTVHIRKLVQSELSSTYPMQNSTKSKLDTCRGHLDNRSLAPWPSFLESMKMSHPNFIPGELYDLFTFEPLHNLHLGFSKLLKQCTYSYICSNHLVSFIPNRKNKLTSISTKKTALLRGCNTYLRALQSDSGIASLHIDFSSKNASATLNGIYLDSGLRGMLEGKDYRNVDYVFPFICSFIDKITQQDSASLTSIHVKYSSLLHQLESEIDSKGLTLRRLQSLRRTIHDLKTSTSNFFKAYVQHGLFTLKFHLLDHLADDLKKFSSLSYLDASPFEQYNAVLKHFYRQTSRRHSTALEETVQRIGTDHQTSSSHGHQQAIPSNPSTTSNTVTQKLVRSGFKISLSDLQCSTSHVNYTFSKDILQNLSIHLVESDYLIILNLIKEQLQIECDGVHPSSVILTFVNSGYVDSFETPSLQDYDEDSNTVRFKERLRVTKSKDRVFATTEFGPTKKDHHSNVFLKGGEDGEEFWFAKVLSLFHLEVPDRNYKKELAFVKYYQTSEPQDNIDRELGCICLRWETEDGLDHSKRAGKSSDIITAGERYGIASFQSICGVAHILRSNYAIPPFYKEIPWPLHRFYVNRFYP